MSPQDAQKRLTKIIQVAPAIRDILTGSGSLEEKRSGIRQCLSELLMATFEDNPAIHPLEWILTRDAIRVFRNLVSTRSERLAGYGFLSYLVAWLTEPGAAPNPAPSAAFLAELDHLFRGIVGKTGIYVDRPPAFLKYSGRKAARMRSTDLSRMARSGQRGIQRFPIGLERSAVARRRRRRERVMAYFNASPTDWQRWQWHVSHIVRHPDVLADLVALSDAEYRAVRSAREHGIPFGITPYYLTLMDDAAGGERDAAVRAQVLPTVHYATRLHEQKTSACATMDFMLENDTSPIDGITRRYPMIAILKPIMTCPQICTYCQRNWEIEDVYSRKAVLDAQRLDAAIRWLAETPEIQEVLITGGDPLMLGNRKLESILSRVAAIDHVVRIRIGSRMPVTLPQRVTSSLVQGIRQYHRPGRREVLLVTHFEHPYEITPEAMAAVGRIRQAGMGVYNQLVFTFFNSRRFEAAALRHHLRLAGVTPYYTFNTKGKDETDEYRVPIARLLQEQKEEARLLPGTIRTDRIVFNVPGLGKNDLGAGQHHDVISILPDGRRVYEFHPWEKKLSLVDTYIYTDVSIHGYLKRLRAIGEETSVYRSIWYYY